MEGPRGVRKEDMPSLRALTGLVMREGLVDQFAQLFNEDNFENLIVCAEDGKCVSHVGMTQGGAVLYGCPIRVACIGGVCTHPDYRKQGLASACFDFAFQKAYDEGVDIMIVSGDRNLYRMRGCVHVGRDQTFTITDENLQSGRTPALDSSEVKPPDRHSHTSRGEELPDSPKIGGWGANLPSVTVNVMKPDELPLVADCYRAEPVRFSRTPEDYGYALQSEYVMNRPSDFLVIRERGDFRGYMIAPRTNTDGKASIAEYAGDRRACLAAMPELFKRYGLSSLGFHVLRHDPLMRSLCEQAGLDGTFRTTPGTVTLVNFPQLMERMRPYFEECLGLRIASGLSFTMEGDQHIFALNNEQMALDRSEACRTLFGTVDLTDQSGPGWHGELGAALRAILPLPTLHYGINYV
jgi:predicted N-acetyltransferase YhbS